MRVVSVILHLPMLPIAPWTSRANPLPLHRLGATRAASPLRRPISSLSTTSTDSRIGRIEKAVDAFFNQDVDAEALLKAQRRRKGIADDDIDWARVKEDDTLYISSKFDSREWWKAEGREKHPLVFLAAPSIISLPGANDFQERAFSACTWFDSPLRQRLKSQRFEMAVLLAVNESLLECEVPTEEKSKEIVEKVIETFKKSPTSVGSADMTLDAEAKDFLTPE